MSEVKRYDISAFGGMSMDESSDGDYVNYEDYEGLEAKCAELAAENAKLADCANFYRLGFKPVKGTLGIEWMPTEQLLDDCGNTAIEAIKTPATDAFLAEVRAQGVDMARNAMIYFVDGEVGPNKNVPGLIRGAEICVSIAEQLRKGGNQ